LVFVKATHISVVARILRQHLWILPQRLNALVIAQLAAQGGMDRNILLPPLW